MNTKALRLTTIITILCLMFTTHVYAYVPRNTPMAKNLKTLNLVVGTDKGFELDKVFTRAQGTVIVIKLLGMDQDVQKANLKSAFGDVPNTHWAAKHIAFAQKNGIVHGIGKGNFSPNRQMTGAELIALVLRGLGYKEAAPKNAVELAVQSGLLFRKEAVGLTEKKGFLRDDMVLVVHMALLTKIKGTNKTLLQDLLDKKVVSREAAVATGLLDSLYQDPMDQIEDAIRRALKK